jgi:hypothetical protein
MPSKVLVSCKPVYFMQKSKSFYHVIEDCGLGQIGSHGWYKTLEEAQKEADRLQSYFPESYFSVFQSDSKREPVIVTI